MSPERLLAIMSNERPSTFKWIYAAGAVTLVLIAIFAVMFAVQEHNDRVLFDEITETSSELQDTGARVMSIRDADMKDMNDYIRAYSRMEPLLNDYDKQFQRITDLCNQAPRGLGGVFCTQEARRIRITQPRAFCITCSFSRG